MIDGLATDTMVASTRIMKKPTIIAHSACHGFAVGSSLQPCSRTRVSAARPLPGESASGTSPSRLRIGSNDVQPTLRTLDVTPDKSGSRQ